MILAEVLHRLKAGEELSFDKRDGMAFLNHIQQYEKDIKVSIVIEYGFKYKFKIIK